MVIRNHAMHGSLLNKGDNRPSTFRTPPATHTFLQTTQRHKLSYPKALFTFLAPKAKPSTSSNQEGNQIIKEGHSNSFLVG